MNKIKYITCDREAGNIIDEFATLSEAEAAIRAYEEEDRANGCYEENFYQIKYPTEVTDCGEYTILAQIATGGSADKVIDLYVGRAADGRHDLIATDNSTNWIVGDADNAEVNRAHWELIAEHIGDIDFDAIRAIDADLAEWLKESKSEAETALVIVDRASYDNGDMTDCQVINCKTEDDYDAISDCWDSIGVGDIIIRGLGERERVMHLDDVTWETRTIEGMADIKADYYVASYSVEGGDGDVDQWEFYAVDGRRLTDEEA